MGGFQRSCSLFSSQGVALATATVLCAFFSLVLLVVMGPDDYQATLSALLLENKTVWAWETMSVSVFVMPFFVVFRNLLAAVLGASFGFFILLWCTTQKLLHLDLPILASDLLLTTSLHGLIHYAPEWPVLVGLGLLACFLLSLLLKQGRIAFAIRPNLVFAVFVASLCWVWSLADSRSPFHGPLSSALELPSQLNWNVRNLASKKGATTLFFHSFQTMQHGRPPGLSVNQTLKLLQDTSRIPAVGGLKLKEPAGTRMQASTPPMALAPKELRHVVVVLLESFMDPQQFSFRLPGDPIARLRSAASGDSSILVQVPTYGGFTANTEFEFLTGIEMSSLPDGSVPFTNLLHKPIYSIARDFSRAGYKTVAIHNYYPGSWHRYSAWPLLGFGQVEFLALPAPLHQKRWPSDTIVFDRIEEVLSQATQPHLIYAVTVGMHGPYDYTAPASPTVRPPDFGNARPPRALAALHNYFHKLLELDAPLSEFVQRLKRANVDYVMFGDHQPSATLPFVQDLKPAKGSGTLPISSRQYLTAGFVSLRHGKQSFRQSRVSVHCLGSLILENTLKAAGDMAVLNYRKCAASGFMRRSDAQADFSLQRVEDRAIAFDVLNHSLGLTASEADPNSVGQTQTRLLSMPR
jgi:phosphoglycerol transferase MdoB-like AlkP superfamily enzyme